jgi:gluconolactonase
VKKTFLLIGLLLLAPGLVSAQAGQEEYPLGPDSNRQPGVPAGVVTHYTWTSKIFPGTTRDYWVYVPAQYSPDKPACVMIFQDGEGFIKEDGRARIPIVFDNLIAKHEMPVTIGVFINPGVLKAASPDQQDRFNRSFEYDGMGDRYARFLLEEIIPEVAKSYNLSTNPDDRAIAGLSSGGICAFTAAWNRPDAFHRVLSFIGSFTDLRGGDVYPNLIRKTEPKPLRVFLQDGNHDLNIYAGDWWMANQTMASALQFAGYDVKFVTGDKDHDMDQGGAILPDALRWLWRDYPQPIAKPAPNHSGDQRTAILDPGSEWEEVPPSRQAQRFIVDRPPELPPDWENWAPESSALAVDAAGGVFYRTSNSIRKVAADGTISVVRDYKAEHKPGLVGVPLQAARGLAIDGSGVLYACEGDQIASYGPKNRRRLVADKLQCQDLTVTRRGGVYFTNPSGRSVWYIPPGAGPHKAGEFIGHINGIALSPDQSLVLVDDPELRWVWSLTVQTDGSLGNMEPFYHLQARDAWTKTNASGMTVDSIGYLYVATDLGIQVCDQPGRVVAIINAPEQQVPLAGIAFGGPDHQELYALAGDTLYKRHLLRKGVAPGVPAKPPVPQL